MGFRKIKSRSSGPERQLVVNPKKCTGCRQCEIVCSISRCGVSNPTKSRIRIIQYKNKSIFIPISCQQCEDAPCLIACPREAIQRDLGLQRVVINYDQCISCKICVSACPFGAIGFDPHTQKVFKCNLCDGDPQCVRFCYPQAIGFTDTARSQYPRIRNAALQYAGFRRKTYGVFSGK